MCICVSHPTPLAATRRQLVPDSDKRLRSSLPLSMLMAVNMKQRL